MNAPATQSTQGRDPANLFKDVQGTVSAVERGDWVSAGLGMANTAMDIVGMASNPLSGFLSAGFSWAIEHVDFLREPFDALLGDPQAIAKMAESWKSAGTQITSIAQDYARTSVEETATWAGKTADGYRRASAKHASGLESLAKAANGVSGAVAGAGQLVATVRKMIMDLISNAVADMVMKIIQWLAASILTFGAAIAGAIADIVSAAVRYAKKLCDFLQKLASSLTKLMNLVKQVTQIAQVAQQVIEAISSMGKGGGQGGGGGAGPRGSAGGLGLTEGQLNNMDRGANDRYTNPGGSGGGTGTSGAGGGGGGGGGGGQVRQPPTVGGGGTGDGHGRWVPGHWEDGTGTSGSGGQVRRPPVVGGTPGTRPGEWYRPDGTSGGPGSPAVRPLAANLDTHATGAGGTPKIGGGGGGGGMPGGMPGGGGGGFGGGGGGAAGGGTMQPGGATGVMPSATGTFAGPGGGGGGVGGSAGGPGGAAAGGMMGGAPMAGQGQQGGSQDHKRKVKIEGEALIDPPKASKPVIGE